MRFFNKEFLIPFLAAFISSVMIFILKPFGDSKMLSLMFMLFVGVPALIINFVGIVLFKNKILIGALTNALGFILGQVTFIFADIFSDSTSHNLWPMELLVVFLITFLSAIFGAALGKLMFRE